MNDYNLVFTQSSESIKQTCIKLFRSFELFLQRNKMCWFECKMKRNCVVGCNNWDGKLIHTVSALDAEYILCETIP